VLGNAALYKSAFYLLAYYEGQGNLANNEIAFLSFPIGRSTEREVARGQCICDVNFGEREVIVGPRWYMYHSRERWCFPIFSPLWPLRYL